MSRRLLLAILGGTSVRLPGCINSTPVWVRSFGSLADCEIDPIEGHACPDDAYERIGRGLFDVDENTLYYEIAEGPADQGFHLTTDTPTVSFGGTVRFQLRNRSITQRETADRSTYSIQQYTTDGWRAVRGWVDEEPFLLDVPFEHNWREGFDWEFTVTKQGIIGPWEVQFALTGCPEVEAGQYRFVYWGFLLSDYALGTCFDVTE